MHNPPLLIMNSIPGVRRVKLYWQKRRMTANFGNVQQATVVIQTMINQTREVILTPRQKEVNKLERQAVALAATKNKDRKIACMKQLRVARGRLAATLKQMEMWRGLQHNVADLWQNVQIVAQIQTVAFLLSGISNKTVESMEKAFNKLDYINSDLMNLTEEIGAATQGINETSEGNSNLATDEELEEEYNNLLTDLTSDQQTEPGTHTHTNGSAGGGAEAETSLFNLDALAVSSEEPSEKKAFLAPSKNKRAPAPSSASRMSSLGLGPPSRGSFAPTSSFRSLLPVGAPTLAPSGGYEPVALVEH